MSRTTFIVDNKNELSFFMKLPFFLYRKEASLNLKLKVGYFL